jgi:hypothetical protein
VAADLVALHRLGKRRQRGLKPLTANPIRGLPGHHECGANLLVIQTSSLPRPFLRRLRSASQQSHHMLAMVARQGHELIEDLDLLGPPGPDVPLTDRTHQFPLRRRAHLPRGGERTFSATASPGEASRVGGQERSDDLVNTGLEPGD